VAANASRTDGAIGYVEYAYAKQNNMTYLKLINKAGKAVSPTAAAFEAAAASADWNGTPGMGVILTDQTGDAVWPIAGATFVLIHKQPADPAAAAEALNFFAWAFDKGGKMAEELDYVTIPKKVQDTIRQAWAANIKDASGKPLYAAK
jgi:phosphate transport system substrate-binding protein